jgi:septal ring factor EnvC (AmiA/AmiB activator)
MMTACLIPTTRVNIAWRAQIRANEGPLSSPRDQTVVGTRPGFLLTLSLGLAAGLLLPASHLSAEPAAANTSAVNAVDALKQRDQELEALRIQQVKALEAERKLRREIEVLGEDRRKLNDALIETATRVRTVEGRLGETEGRLNTLDEQQRGLRTRLNGRRAVIAEILAALQRIGHRPPPVVIVGPEDALHSVRSAMTLGAVLPEMRDRAEALAVELGELAKVRKDIAEERNRLTRDLSVLGDERQRMALLVEERQKRQGDVEKAVEAERQQALALANQSDNLKDLIFRLERNLDGASRSARAMARANEAKPAVDSRTQLAALKDPGRLGPAVAFASARGLLPFPVNGVKIRDYGATDGLGGAEKGISVATRAGADVTAPCDGWVVYAGPFRSYGKLLILNAGGGYHILIAGMERISVDLGQFVLTGEPVASMGSGPPGAAALATGASQPVLYVEFRKDGTPVDPSPWWAASEGEKVRG